MAAQDLWQPVQTQNGSFCSHFDISPQAYHSYHRYQMVRQMLIHDKHTSITQAALKYGYLHMGHFSKKYKMLFGELPSETLRRV